jgi:hypothetical protein
LAQEPATATTEPVGFVTVGVAAGTGAAKRNTLFSLPLLETDSITGQVAGTITGLTANTISNVNAGWGAGDLSDPSSPYLIQITSGDAEGRMFLISSSANTGGAISGTANTSDTVTVSSIDATQTSVSDAGVRVGDTYKIYACDTLSSFFGTPQSNGVQGGTSAANADTIVAVVNGSTSTYFFSTSVNRWVRAAIGNPDSSNVALLPYYGIQYARIADSPLSFVITGSVPTKPRQVAVKNSGTTIISQYWPVEATLATSGLQTVLTQGASPALADTVVLTSGGAVSTYFFNGTNWKRAAIGTPDADSTVIPIGAGIQIVRKGSAPGFTALAQDVPYDLN